MEMVSESLRNIIADDIFGASRREFGRQGRETLSVGREHRRPIDLSRDGFDILASLRVANAW